MPASQEEIFVNPNFEKNKWKACIGPEIKLICALGTTAAMASEPKIYIKRITTVAKNMARGKSRFGFSAFFT